MTPMNETAAQTVELRLLPYEGTCLQGILKTLVSEAGDVLPQDQLAPIIDRLDESNAVASWLGEYVRLELHPDEVVDLLETIVAALNSDRVEPRNVGVTLSNIGEKLATFGYSRHGGRPR